MQAGWGMLGCLWGNGFRSVTGFISPTSAKFRVNISAEGSTPQPPPPSSEVKKLLIFCDLHSLLDFWANLSHLITHQFTLEGTIIPACSTYLFSCPLLSLAFLNTNPGVIACPQRQASAGPIFMASSFGLLHRQVSYAHMLSGPKGIHIFTSVAIHFTTEVSLKRDRQVSWMRILYS